MSAQQKDLRADRLNRLEDKINQTKKVVESEDPGVRILSRKLMEMKVCWREYEDAHMTYITKERNEEDKKTASEEHTTWVDKYDEMLDPAEVLKETLEAAALPAPRVPLAEQKDLLNIKIDAAYKLSKERIKRLKDFIDDSESEARPPNAAQLEKFDDGIKQIRCQLDAEYTPLFDQLEDCCVSRVELGQSDEKKKEIRETLTLELDNLSLRIIKLIPPPTHVDAPPLDATTLAAAFAAATGSTSRSSTHATPAASYKSYAKESIPHFKGELRLYPSWKKEMMQLVLTDMEEVHKVRVLDKYTPSSVDLQNCVTEKEAWKELDTKYGNAVNITTTLMDEFFRAKLKAKTDESKVVELKTLVMRLSTDLTSVKHESNLHGNPYALNHIVKLMPRFWQNKYSEQVDQLTSTKGSQWLAISSFLKDESHRIETQLPWTLDSYEGDKGRDNNDEKSEAKKWDVSMLPKSLRKQVNAALSKGPEKEGAKSDKSDPKKSSRFDEMAGKIGNCPSCQTIHTYVSRTNQLFVSGSLKDCQKFKDMTPQQRAQETQKHKACAACLDWGHERGSCSKPKRPCNIDSCTLLHHRMIHGTRVAYVNLVKGGRSVREVTRSSTHEFLDEFKSDPMMLQSPSDDTPRFLHIVNTHFSEKGITLATLLDDGSDSSFITISAAGFLNLKGTKKLTYLLMAGQESPTAKMLYHYEVPIKLPDGKAVNVVCIGMEQITENCSNKVDISKAYSIFPHVPPGAFERPTEEIHILIGQDHAALLASGGRDENVFGNLRAMRTPLGTGWVLGGWHEDIPAPRINFTATMNVMKSSRIMSSPKRINFVIKCESAFPELCDLSVQLPRKCNRCKNCQNCRYEVEEISKREQKELDLIREMVEINDGKCSASYPVIGNLENLKYNEWQAVAIAESLERSLKKKGDIEQYNAEVDDFLNRGVLVEVTRSEIAKWQESGGTACFITHHCVDRPDKATTKKRLVSNSSLKNYGRGPSPNEMWPKGPNALKSMIGIFLRFRIFPVALHFDITKMFHTVITGDPEKFMRLIVWRHGVKEAGWKIYGFAKVSFGDRPATCILEVCKDLVAEKGRHFDKLAATAIEEDSFVDDGCTGGTEEEVQRLMGEMTEKDGELFYTGTIQKILSLAGFKLKMMVKSGENDERALNKMGGSILGHEWIPETDVFVFKFVVHLGKKRRNGLYDGPPLFPETLNRMDGYTWNKSSVLSVVAGQYDPTGMVSCYLVKHKLFLRGICQDATGWESPLSSEKVKVWKEHIVEMVTAPPIQIARCTKPINAIGKPDLIAFSDGSLMAYCVAIYIRWKLNVLKSGPWASEFGRVETWESRLILAKCRVAPLAGITTPRSEMNGHVMANRLTSILLAAMRDKPERVVFLLDSECTIAAIQSEHGHLTAYLANRRAEVLETWDTWADQYPEVKIEPLLHIPGEENVSDLGTRDKIKASEIGDGSVWQRGPHFLSEARKDWPASSDVTLCVPKEELVKEPYPSVHSKINFIRVTAGKNKVYESWKRLKDVMLYSHSLLKVKGILARLIRLSNAATKVKGGWNTKDNKAEIMSNLIVPLKPEDLEKAEKMLLFLSQDEVSQMIETPPKTKVKGTNKRKLSHSRSTKPKSDVKTMNMASISPFKQKNVYWTQGRFGADLKKVLGPSKLAILPPSSRLSYLYMVKAHEQAHRGGGDTCFRSRAYAWIVRARPLADKIAENCWTCKRKCTLYLQQKMSDLPEERLLIPSKPFTSIAVDFLGPYSVKAMNNARSKLKVWPVVLGCHNTGALHVELCWTYGTDSFLVAFSAFVAVRGRPRMAYTDQGSQLLKAAERLTVEDPANWDWKQVEEKSGQEGTSWRFCPPGSQWRNGMAEARVKALKECMDLLIPSGVEHLNFAEFQTLLSKCCNIINDRPLGVRKNRIGTEGVILPITPNLLLLGRTSTGMLDPPTDDEEDQYSKRTAFVNELEALWWSMWWRQVWDGMLPFTKWKRPTGNLEIGDICLMGWESKLGKGQYRLCRVIDTEPDRHDTVRTVTIEARPKNSREKGLPYLHKDLQETRISVQRLILIHPAGEPIDVFEDLENAPPPHQENTVQSENAN